MDNMIDNNMRTRNNLLNPKFIKLILYYKSAYDAKISQVVLEAWRIRRILLISKSVKLILFYKRADGKRFLIFPKDIERLNNEKYEKHFIDPEICKTNFAL